MAERCLAHVSIGAVDDGLIPWLTLARCADLGGAAAHRLVQNVGSARGAIEQGPAALRDPVLARAVRREIERAARAGWTLLHRDHPRWPAMFEVLPLPPLVLWASGRTELLGTPAAAVVGSRRMSTYGARVATELAAGLARLGVTIVSGMARGIDAAAHEAALEADGGSVAVWGTGYDVVYPREHRRLAERLQAGGLVLTEFPPGTAPLAPHFPRRNRIIAALSDAVVVVEASLKSGSLLTAGVALELGRPVLAVPGRVGDPGSEGVLELIHDGAGLARHAADVVAALGPGRRPDGTGWRVIEPDDPLDRCASSLDADARRVFGLLPVDEERHVDMLIEQSGESPAVILTALFALQLAGLVEALPGGVFRRAPSAAARGPRGGDPV